MNPQTLPPPAADLRPPHQSAPAWQPPTRARRPWKDRLPELLAMVGVGLVALAVTGFLSSTWGQITPLMKGLGLLMASLGVFSAASWIDREQADRLGTVVGVAHAAGVLLTASGLTLIGLDIAPERFRVIAALAGAAGAAQGGFVWMRRRDSVSLQVSVFGAIAYAVGPFGTSVSDRFEDTLVHAAEPFAALFNPFLASSDHLVTAIGHLVLGVGWLLVSRTLDGRAKQVGASLTAVTLGYAALQFNLLPWAVGAVIALGIVLALLIAGLVREDTTLVVGGTIGTGVAGLRVLLAVFSGEVVATLLVLAAGIGLIAWALRAIGARRDGDADVEVAG